MTQTPSTDPQRLDVYLAQHYPELSRSSWTKHIQDGNVSIDGVVATKPKVVVPADGQVTVDIPEPAKKVPLNIEIIYQDDDVIVLNKPAGVLTHARGVFDNEYTLVDFLEPFVQDSQRKGIVHRLDRETSGIIIAARTVDAREYLQQQFAERVVEKVYRAILDGVVEQDSATFDWPIERNPRKQHLFRVGPNGKKAITTLSVVNRFKKHSVVELAPKTGRTHQLRVHMAHFEHPIVGDAFYNPKSLSEIMYLHAQSLKVKIPNGKLMEFNKQPDWDLDRFL